MRKLIIAKLLPEGYLEDDLTVLSDEVLLEIYTDEMQWQQMCKPRGY